MRRVRSLSTTDTESVVATIGRLIGEACRRFTRSVDWRHCPRFSLLSTDQGVRKHKLGYMLSENHEGLRSGNFITVNLSPSADALSIEGGYFDSYYQPNTVYVESMPLGEVTPQKVNRILLAMHDKLDAHVLRPKGRAHWAGYR